ncbi:MAG: hypothetical protein KF718_23890 [Polyangiaceae bacterium]|nr:hypothetical protein [Polyangiaceae bacterium]
MIASSRAEVPSRDQSTLAILCGWLALVLPLGITVWRTSATTQWRDDLPVVRALGLIPLGGEGVVSSVLMQVSSLLPIGGRLGRAALVGALGLALTSRLLHAHALRSLDANAWTPRLGPVLALSAALTATLGATFQLEGTIASGAPIAVALVLFGLLIRPDAQCDDARVWLGFGALVALTALESHVAGACLVVALAAQVGLLGELPTRSSLKWCALGAVFTAALCLVPQLVRPFSDRAWVHLGFGLSTAALTPLDSAADKPGALAVWLREVGVVSLGLGVLGAAWGLLRGRTRWLVAPLALFVLADVVFPASRTGVLITDPLVPLRLLSLVALSITAVLGLQTLALGLVRASIPFARPIAALLVIFQATLVLMTGEDAAYVADRRRQTAAEVWTDEALRSLPPRSLLLVRSEAVAWRLWAARVVRGERPDLVIVPMPLLDRGSVATSLLEFEPALAPLIREVALSGKPNEFSLSSLSDVRPLYVELDPSWDTRLVHHLVPERMWLGFAPHALGRSDRKQSFRLGRTAFERVLDVANETTHRDLATLSVLSARAREQAFALATLGDRESVAHLMADLSSIDPEHPFVADMTRRLARGTGSIDVSGLAH